MSESALTPFFCGLDQQPLTMNRSTFTNQHYSLSIKLSINDIDTSLCIILITNHYDEGSRRSRSHIGRAHKPNCSDSGIGIQILARQERVHDMNVGIAACCCVVETGEYVLLIVLLDVHIYFISYFHFHISYLATVHQMHFSMAQYLKQWYGGPAGQKGHSKLGIFTHFQFTFPSLHFQTRHFYALPNTSFPNLHFQIGAVTQLRMHARMFIVYVVYILLQYGYKSMPSTVNTLCNLSLGRNASSKIVTASLKMQVWKCS